MIITITITILDSSLEPRVADIGISSTRVVSSSTGFVLHGPQSIQFGHHLTEGRPSLGLICPTGFQQIRESDWPGAIQLGSLALVHHLVDEFFFGKSFEGNFVSGHLPEHDPEGINIRFLTVRMAENYFRCHVAERTRVTYFQ
jgi:hypothetical protein